MFGEAMRCDICDHTEILDAVGRRLMDDLTVPAGWVRVYAHRPRMWPVVSGQSLNPRSDIELAYDCCSTTCALTALQDHVRAVEDMSVPHHLT